jgi:hypothetical protein
MDKTALQALIYTKGQELGLSKEELDQMINAKPKLTAIQQAQLTGDQLGNLQKTLNIQQDQVITPLTIQEKQMAIDKAKKESDSKTSGDAALLALFKTGQLPVTKDVALKYPDLAAQYLKDGGKIQVDKNAPEQKNAQAMDSTLNFINNLEQHYRDGYGATFGTGIGARLGGKSKELQAALGYAPEANQYLSAKQGFAATLKSLTGDTGVMTDQDFARLSKLLPDLGSTPQEAVGKFNDLRSQLSAKFGGASTKTKFSPKGTVSSSSKARTSSGYVIEEVK